MASKVIPFPGPTGGPINSPELPETGKLPDKPPTRAVKDERQASQLITDLESENRERNLKNARIQSRINAEKPFTQAKLEADGLGYKSNFSTQVLSSIVEKVAPRFRTAINSVRYLTNSALPEDETKYPGHKDKTERFRDEITKLIRAREDWQELTAEISQENSVFGYTCAAWPDEFSWFPIHYRGDKFLIPVGTKQLANKAQVIVLIDELLPNELFDFIRDSGSASDAGWNIKNTVLAINTAMPELYRSKESDHARVYEDLTREANSSASALKGANVIRIYNILAREVTGKVTHWKVAKVPAAPKFGEPKLDYLKLFHREDRFDNMSDAATFFSLQFGNGTMHSSKGVGRILYNLAQTIEKTRNEVVDRLNLSGKVLIQGDEKQIKRFRMSVVGNAVIIGRNFEISSTRLDGATEPFLTLDQYLNGLADQLVGNVSPRQLEGERVTAAQVNLYAAREEEAKDNALARFMIQFSRMVSQMQKRAMSKDCSDPAANKVRERLLTYMSEEELDILASTPSAGVVQDYSELERQRNVLLAQELTGNPLIDQVKLHKLKIQAQAGPDLAKDLLLPENDPTIAAEQIRTQSMENLILALGQEVPVSPRDNHEIHLETLWPAVQQSLEALVANPEAAELIKISLDHARNHVQLGTAAAGTAGGFQAWANRIAEVEAALAQLAEHEKALQASMQQGLPPEAAVQAGSVAAADAAAATAPPVSPQAAAPEPAPSPVQPL